MSTGTFLPEIFSTAVSTHPASVGGGAATKRSGAVLLDVDAVQREKVKVDVQFQAIANAAVFIEQARQCAGARERSIAGRTSVRAMLRIPCAC